MYLNRPLFVAVLLVGLLAYTTVGLLENESGYNVLAEPESGPTCYRCYRSTHGDSCVTMSGETKLDEVTCAVNNSCMVERYTVDRTLTTFVRRCAKECVPGCQSVGRNYRVQTCYSCCAQDLCNTDNGSGRINVMAMLPMIAAGVFLL